MIIPSQNLITSPIPGLDLNSPVIGWDNLVRYGGITADSEDPNFPAALLSNPATTYKWKSLSTASQYLTIDVQPDDVVDYVGIARHNLGTTGTKVSVEANISNVWTEVFPEITPGDDSPLILRFAPVLTAELYRIKLTPPSSGDPPTIAVVYLGRLTILERKIYVGHTPLPYGRDTEFTNGVAENGDFQGRIELKSSLSTSVNLSNITPSWYRNYLDSFVALGRKRTFFFAWRPFTYSREVGYAWLTNNPKPVNQRSNGMMQIGLQMGGLVL